MLIEKKTLEKDVQKYFKDQLKEFKSLWARKWSDRYLSNMPDWVVVYRAVTYWIELKRPSGRLRAGQEREGNNIIGAGGIFMTLLCRDDVDRFIEMLRTNAIQAARTTGTGSEVHDRQR